jgi:hypothetical protein
MTQVLISRITGQVGIGPHTSSLSVNQAMASGLDYRFANSIL